MCPRCRERLETEEGEVSAAELITAIMDCCSKTLGFITRESPALESIFRLFLANGNEPLDLEQLSLQLEEWWGGDSYRTSIDILSRLLSKDQYYGLRQVQ